MAAFTLWALSFTILIFRDISNFFHVYIYPRCYISSLTDVFTSFLCHNVQGRNHRLFTSLMTVGVKRKKWFRCSHCNHQGLSPRSIQPFFLRRRRSEVRLHPGSAMTRDMSSYTARQRLYWSGIFASAFHCAQDYPSCVVLAANDEFWPTLLLHSNDNLKMNRVHLFRVFRPCLKCVPTRHCLHLRLSCVSEVSSRLLTTRPALMAYLSVMSNE